METREWRPASETSTMAEEYRSMSWLTFSTCWPTSSSSHTICSLCTTRARLPIVILAILLSPEYSGSDPVQTCLQTSNRVLSSLPVANSPGRGYFVPGTGVLYRGTLLATVLPRCWTPKSGLWHWSWPLPVSALDWASNAWWRLSTHQWSCQTPHGSSAPTPLAWFLLFQATDTVVLPSIFQPALDSHWRTTLSCIHPPLSQPL